MDIRILPSNIANVIAAGEVVARPASVVKELMENAVDSGADQISVVITDAGRTLIQVIDNGCGMDPDEAVVCFERHATSKIATAEDLESITTFGFRGEALASIAAVAEVRLRTRKEGADIGCEVEFADSKQISAKEIATPQGANFAVRNLFYNVPARRKFLKSDNVELRHIIDEFTRVALTRPEIGFSLSHNGKDIYVLKPAKTLKFRILDLLGTNVVGDIVDVKAETTVATISGFIGKPEGAKKTLGNQYFFVNGRYFRSPYLHKAVMKAYENMISEGTAPSYFLYLEADPHSVDVNISPTKTEVKFEDDSILFQVVYACVKANLGKHSFAGGLDFDKGDVPDIPVFGKNFDEYRPMSLPQTSADPNYNPFDPKEPDLSSPSAPMNYSKFVEKPEDYNKLFEDKSLPLFQNLTIQGKYIIAPAKSGIMLVNIQRAFERILYERFLEAVSKNKHITQISMFPVRVDVGAANRLIFDENSDLLSSLGFDISPFGNDCIVVNGLPEGYCDNQGKIEAMMADLLLILTDPHSSIAQMMESSLAEKLAVLGAKNSYVPSSVEAQRVLEQLLSCENSEFTSSGHRIIVLIPIEEIDKKF